MAASTHPQASTSTTPGATRSDLSSNPRVTGVVRSTETPKPQSDTISDQATAAFVRRTLCSHNVLLGNGDKGRSTPRPIEELLPPLTSSNEVDLQLYGIISIIIKEFVQTWYSKITPDHVFVNEVLQIIAHCTRALEQRLRIVDLEAMLLDEIPELIETHLSSFRLAKQHAFSPESLVSDPRLVFHTLQPHPALSPVPTDAVPSTSVEQRENESAWRQLIVQGVLTVLLPPEDLENGCLRALVAEIFAEMILGNGISGKACEGWLLWEGITSIAKVLQTDSAKEKGNQSEDASPQQSMTRLERFGLLSSAHKEAEPTSLVAPSKHRHKTWPMSISGFFWTVAQYIFLAITAVRAVVLNLVRSSSLPSRSVNLEQSPAGTSNQPPYSSVETPLSRRALEPKRPIVSMRLWSCMAQLAELSMRMPWLAGSISMLHWGLLVGPGRVGDTDGILDRFLSDTIYRRILNPTFVPAILRTLRATIFPNNALGPPRQPPSEDGAKELKRCCATSLLNLIPSKLAAVFFATQEYDLQLVNIEEMLSCLDDSYLNKHLIFQIVELIVLRLVPELGERGVRELMEERSIDAHADLSMHPSSTPKLS
ncbi:PXA domain-containing protein [Phaeosphaeriaceae sp. PMI808]|nr:PXA domain-containing protein [Phaeosphaeriaceae sp. PMI808]